MEDSRGSSAPYHQTRPDSVADMLFILLTACARCNQDEQDYWAAAVLSSPFHVETAVWGPGTAKSGDGPRGGLDVFRLFSPRVRMHQSIAPVQGRGDRRRWSC